MNTPTTLASSLVVSTMLVPFTKYTFSSESTVVPASSPVNASCTPATTPVLAFTAYSASPEGDGTYNTSSKGLTAGMPVHMYSASGVVHITAAPMIAMACTSHGLGSLLYTPTANATVPALFTDENARRLVTKGGDV